MLLLKQYYICLFKLKNKGKPEQTYIIVNIAELMIGASDHQKWQK